MAFPGASFAVSPSIPRTGIRQIHSVGLLPAVTGEALIDAGSVGLSIEGMLPAVEGAAEVDLGSNALTINIGGDLPAVTGAASVKDKNGITIEGTLPAVTGAASLKDKIGAAISGLLSAVTGSASVKNKNGATAAGTLPAVTGAASVHVSNPFVLTSGSTSGSATSYNVPVPSGAAGDKLYIYVDARNTTAPTTPSGFTVEAADTATVYGAWLYSKVRDGSEGSTITVAFGNAVARELVSVNVANHNGQDGAAAHTKQDNNGTTISTPSVTTTAAGELLLHFLGAYTNGTWGNPSGFTSYYATSGHDPGVSVSYLVAGSAGTYGPYACTTQFAIRRASALVALKPQ